MPEDVVHARIYRFHEYTLDPGRRILLRQEKRVALTPKALDVLLTLVSRSREVVSKDELLRTVWPDVVVEEIGLARNISVLRKIFGEKPGEHNFIVTVPGVGYRFVAEVEAVPTQLLQATRSPPFPVRWVAVLAIVLVAGACATVWFLRPAEAPRAWQALPLTTYPGTERHPALSPDGKMVAFSWDGEHQDNFDIYVKSTAKSTTSDAASRLTSDSAEDGAPVWSPDGRTIAFVRRKGHDWGEIVSVPYEGGSERKLSDSRGEFRTELPSLAWSPDGTWIAMSHRDSTDAANGLFLFSVRSGEKRRLTTPPTGSVGDYMPAFSRDGRSLSFVRLLGWAEGGIELLDISGDGWPIGDIRPLTVPGRLIINPVWAQNGRDLMYLASNAPMGRRLRVVEFSNAKNDAEVAGFQGEISGFASGPHLIYSVNVSDRNIWRAEIRSKRDGTGDGAPVRLIVSTRVDDYPKYSPDGIAIAFATNRSGKWEIWLAGADGSNQRKLASFSGGVGQINWSPDGRQIVFDTSTEGQTALFTVGVRDGSVARLTKDRAGERTASYSHDGRSIYFSSLRSGRWEIWKMPSRGGEAIQITHSEGSYMPIESPDGATVYFCHKSPEKGIWKIPANGGVAEAVTGPYRGPLCGLAVSRHGIYYTAANPSARQHVIAFQSFAGGKAQTVVVSDRSMGILALSVSPEERYLIYGQLDQSGSDLMMVENFAAR